MGYPNEGVTIVETVSGANETRTVIVEEETDATGVATFDLAQFAISEIFDFATEVIDSAADLASLVFAQKLTITNTSATVVAYNVSAVTGALVSAGANVNIRLKLLCR